MLSGRERAASWKERYRVGIDSSIASDWQRALDAECGSGDNALILDLEQLTFICSAGLRVVLAAAQKFKDEDKQFGLCSPSKAVGETIGVSGLDQLISVYDSHFAALSAMEDC